MKTLSNEPIPMEDLEINSNSRNPQVELRFHQEEDIQERAQEYLVINLMDLLLMDPNEGNLPQG